MTFQSIAGEDVRCGDLLYFKDDGAVWIYDRILCDADIHVVTALNDALEGEIVDHS